MVGLLECFIYTNIHVAEYCLFSCGPRSCVYAHLKKSSFHRSSDANCFFFVFFLPKTKRCCLKTKAYYVVGTCFLISFKNIIENKKIGMTPHERPYMVECWSDVTHASRHFNLSYVCAANDGCYFDDGPRTTFLLKLASRLMPFKWSTIAAHI